VKRGEELGVEKLRSREHAEHVRGTMPSTSERTGDTKEGIRSVPENERTPNGRKDTDKSVVQEKYAEAKETGH
jgi:hypothetical protein